MEPLLSSARDPVLAQCPDSSEDPVFEGSVQPHPTQEVGPYNRNDSCVSCNFDIVEKFHHSGCVFSYKFYSLSATWCGFCEVGLRPGLPSHHLKEILDGRSSSVSDGEQVNHLIEEFRTQAPAKTVEQQEPESLDLSIQVGALFK